MPIIQNDYNILVKNIEKKRKFCEAIFGRICLPKLNTNPEMAITKKADHYLGWILWSDYDFTQYVFSLSPFMQPCKCFIGLVSCFWFNRIFWPKENFNNQLFKNIFFAEIKRNFSKRNYSVEYNKCVAQHASKSYWV